MDKLFHYSEDPAIANFQLQSALFRDPYAKCVAHIIKQAVSPNGWLPVFAFTI
ncbi:hypothetical protein [Brevibacillus brevis]|uniref:hypothetical protein n=1 Tax=Brevibacillus brevis TaxID=1393 RepID=UPI001C8E4FA4|nr:hypothetical protein [Brevibacillus brevis]MBY0087687.1 hypothetical protein [Brevibacillus brevis]